MADTNESYHVVACANEASGTVRSLKTILEAELAYSLPGSLAVSIAIQNKSANSLFVQSQSGSPANANIELASGLLKQWPAAGAFRYDLRDIYVRVNTTNDVFSVEVTLE
jgi:hypothetical protein